MTAPRRRAPKPKTSAATGESSPIGFRQVAIALLPVLLLTALAYAGSFSNEFLNFDDPANILENGSITAVTGAHLATYFTRPLMGMYSPLTYLSYAIDFKMGALDVTVYHATNLLLHLLNVSLVCAIVLRLSGSLASSALVAALFAVSPVNVAAVAPLSVRSSLLYSLFYLAAYLAYLSYVRTGRRLGLLLSSLLFVLSLLSKSAAVVFPLLLLLTDYFVGRWRSPRVLLEKVPFLIASAAFGIVALRMRDDVAAMAEVFPHTVLETVCLTAYGILFYPIKLLAPLGLSALYSYPARVNGHLPWLFYAAPIALAAIVVAAAFWKSQRRLLVFGGLFFVLHIALILKVIPLGVEFTADRYAYLPSIGLFFIGLELVRQASPSVRRAGLAAVTVMVLLCSAAAYARAADWKDSVTFYTRVLEQDPDNAFAHNNLARTLSVAHQDAEAVAHYKEAIRLAPAYLLPHLNLANELVTLGRSAEAIPEFMAAVALDPANAETRHNLGVALAEQGRLNDAIVQYAAVLAIRPDWPKARVNLGGALASTGRLDEAAVQFIEALRLAPDLADAHRNLGMLRAQQGRTDDAIHEFQEAVRADPKLQPVYYNLGVLLSKQGRMAEAIRALDSALSLDPNDVAARRLRESVLARGKGQ